MTTPALPIVQDLEWMWCKACSRYPWDCNCPRSWECVKCGAEVTSPDDKPAPCDEGEHEWKNTTRDDL